MPKHSQVSLDPFVGRDVGLVVDIKGVGNGAFYRGIKRDYLRMIPALPERTRLFRLVVAHPDWPV